MSAIFPYDLHCHSTYSDGLLTPTELVARAAARGVKVLAVTDHDELGGLEEADDAARAERIELVPGVEVSASWGGHTLHVVGLYIDRRARALAEGLARIRAGREGRARRIAEGLAAAGIDGALEGARAYATNPHLVSRTHFARFLVERGHARDLQAVFRRYLTAGHPGYVPHAWARLEDAIGWIRMAGGMAVLAHPGRYRIEHWEREELLACFVAHGGAGVEVVSGSQPSGQYGTWGQAARRHGLLASCGSEFHAPGESRRDLGELPPLPAGCTPVWTAF
jgi:3',5'-nucleoside bisphosphate phosphatase